MGSLSHHTIKATSYDRSACAVGVVHLGFGAFHRAHQAVYIDDYMQASGDLRWGIAAVNLRGSEAEAFQSAESEITGNDGYLLKSISPSDQVEFRTVRSHVQFADWSKTPDATEDLLALDSVHLVTITVTESGYYLDEHGNLNPADPTIAAEVSGNAATSVYAYLRRALARRQKGSGAPLTIACCDNIRQNGKMLRRNLLAYLTACADTDLHDWVAANVAFPCSMVDRITPRSPDSLAGELSVMTGRVVQSPIMAEEFLQWVLQTTDTTPMPDLAQVGVTVTADVDPYEETKIRVLNGGHTALTYLAALKGLNTFDEAMRDADLAAHFEGFETTEVLFALRDDLPFSKEDYLASIRSRFGNRAIGDTVARICADGMAKFPIFVRPTIEGCLAKGHLPRFAIRSIASWHLFARHVSAGKVPFKYVEPSWSILEPMLGTDAFINNAQLWGDIPETYPEFGQALREEIKSLEETWPV